MDLLEPQKYPELQAGVTGPTKRPYDVAGWTLSMQMGVTVDRVDARFDGRSVSPYPNFRRRVRCRAAARQPSSITARMLPSWLLRIFSSGGAWCAGVPKARSPYSKRTRRISRGSSVFPWY